MPDALPVTRPVDLGELEHTARSLAERARLLEQALVGVALFAEQLARDIREATT